MTLAELWAATWRIAFYGLLLINLFYGAKAVLG
jgi:hypothetical protein